MTKTQRRKTQRRISLKNNKSRRSLIRGGWTNLSVGTYINILPTGYNDRDSFLYNQYNEAYNFLWENLGEKPHIVELHRYCVANEIPVGPLAQASINNYNRRNNGQPPY